jgi:hypothetical protein
MLRVCVLSLSVIACFSGCDMRQAIPRPEIVIWSSDRNAAVSPVFEVLQDGTVQGESGPFKDLDTFCDSIATHEVLLYFVSSDKVTLEEASQFIDRLSEALARSAKASTVKVYLCLGKFEEAEAFSNK